MATTATSSTTATPTLTSLGVGSGLQLQSILDQLRAADTAQITVKQSAITTCKSQLSEFTTVNNKLLALKSDALNLSLSETFLSRTVSSSSEGTVTATVAAGTPATSSAVTVTNLAQKSSWVSSGVADDSTSIAITDTPLSIQIGTTKSTLSIAAGTTMSQLADQINSAPDNPGVTATVINNGDPNTPYQLVLTANSTGETNRISINNTTTDNDITASSTLADLSISDQNAAGSLNAQFKVDGISYQRQTNSVSDALYGVTLNLNGTGSSTVSVANNTSGQHDMITSLVTDYNAAVQEVKTNSAYDTTTSTFGILNSTTLADLPYDLEGLMTSTNTADPSGKIKSLFDLGLTFSQDGTISIDDTALTNAISTQPDGVSALFLGDSSKNITGLADQINNRLRTMTSGSGIIAGQQNSTQSRIDDLNQQIADDTARLDKKYAMMTSQFVALDSYMSQMTSMSNFLTGQFNSLSNGWSGTGTNSNNGSSS